MKEPASPSLLDRLFRLDGRVAVVTGGAGRIGRVLCRALADVGARVAIVDLAAESAHALAEDIGSRGGQALAVPADVTSTEELELAVATIARELAAPEILVNSTQFRGAGFYSSDPGEYPREAWDRVLEVNLSGTLLACQAFGRAMIVRGGGRIVNLASTYGVVSADPRIYGQSGVNSPVSYGASKAGVIQLTRYLAVHWREQNVRVNCLVPGGVFDGQSDDFVAAYCARTPLGRMARPEDYIGAVLLMVADASAYMTGSVVTVDGGWTAW